MFWRHKSLLLALLVTLTTSFWWGCTQPDDVFTPVYKTEMRLIPERLPTNPPGMVYSLWATGASNGDTAYIGQFAYDLNDGGFYNADGTLRPDGNLFTIDKDLFSFSHIFVSIDTIDFDMLHPGPVMLVDVVAEASENPIQMIFPQVDSLWLATIRYNMETTSDNSRSMRDGYGIWFANYSARGAQIRDTFSMTSFVLDSVILHDLGDKTDTTSIRDTANYSEQTVNLVYGLDTFAVEKAIFDYVFFTDTDSPWVVYEPRFGFSTGNTQSITYDDFTQDDFGLIDYSAIGWKYKGWVVSPNIDTAATGNLTPPAWLYNTAFDSIIPGADGGLISTGTFSNIAAADDANPYSLGDRVPAFPGEDFLANQPGGWDGNLVPLASGNSGAIFITLEPDNFVTDTTNFPLFVFIGDITKNRADLTGSMTLDGYMRYNDPWQGFPAVSVEVTRF